ncbi:MAG TPA: acyl-CoA dehydrogenase family protein [Pseudonocardia sp.]|jgi:acyl-CoA dehydrogenase
MSETSALDATSETEELANTARAVCADHPAESVEQPPGRLWETLEELGLARLTLSESAGGSGGTLADAAALLLTAGEAAAPVPLAETDLLAGWLLDRAGLAVPAGPLAAAADGGELTVRSGQDGSVTVTGALARVGWARHAARIAVLAAGTNGADVVLSIDPAADGVEIVPGTNLAGEPRDGVRLDTEVAPADVAVAPPGTRDLLARRAALARALLLAGAAGSALASSVRYAGERVQFGRPIAKFQAVQQQLALAAAEVAAARASAMAAARICAAARVNSDGDFEGPDAEFAVAVAKGRTGEAASAVARIAHQVHGAIGFTLEHDLRLATTRLWSWRDEDGSDAHWHTVVGRRALAEGPDGLWPLLTRAS